MKNSMHRPISSGQPAQAYYLTLFSRSICLEKSRCAILFLSKYILEMINFFVIFLEDLNHDLNSTGMR